MSVYWNYIITSLISSNTGHVPRQNFRSLWQTRRREPTLEWSTQVGSGLNRNYWTSLEKLARDKRSGLLQKLTVAKSFITLVPEVYNFHYFGKTPKNRFYLCSLDVFKLKVILVFQLACTIKQQVLDTNAEKQLS